MYVANIQYGKYVGVEKYNLVGRRFGRLLVLEYLGSDKDEKRVWRCVCDCGAFRDVKACLLMTKNKERKVDSCVECKWGRQIPIFIGDGIAEYPLATRCEDNPCVKLDVEDLALVEVYRWQALRVKKMYAVTTQSRPMLFMHRLIVNAPDGFEVDHINGNGLDNRRCNLRVVSHAQNTWNRGKTKRSSSSRFIGVGSSVRRGSKRSKWYSHIVVGSRNHHLGYFDSEEEAARVYDEAALFHRGKDFAVLNFPELVNFYRGKCPRCTEQCKKHGR